MTSLEGVLRDQRVVVCVGTGGVGKTTVSATMALEAARSGRRVLLLTIDPARRLADALGVEELGNEAREVSPERRAELGIDAGGGRLDAMMLDMKRTFDDLVERFAESPEARERILANAIYQHVSDALAGSGEYTAMEKVYEMSTAGEYDLVVVDTPPSQHALEFLEAPQRLMEFLDSRIVGLLLHPAFAAGRVGVKLFQGATQRVFRLMERVSGVQFLEDISEFLLAFEGMSEGFKARARHVRELLLGPRSSFVLVAGASPEAARNAMDFLADLDGTGAPLAGVVVNRMHAWPDGGDAAPTLPASGEDEACIDRLADALRGAPDGASIDAPAAARAAVDLARGYAALVALDRDSTAPLRDAAADTDRFYRWLPELAGDVHDLDALQTMGALLFGRSAPDDA